MGITIRRYSPELAGDWAAVLERARNGIFQYERGYIEYHGERFNEMSVLAYLDDRPVALMPAAIDVGDSKIISHPGLTFGGVVFDEELRGGEGIEIVNAILDAVHGWGARLCLIKPLPSPFARYPAAEVDYALWRRGFVLVRRDLSSLLPLEHSLPFNSSKRQGIKKARKAGAIVREASIAEFHDLLQRVLLARHGVAPVHNCEELELLKSRFPARIFTRAAYLHGEIMAGTLVYNYDHVWHTQYLASSQEGRNQGALDLVIAELVNEARTAGVKYLSFGTSTVNQGRTVNEGLLWQKESYGARALVHDFMEGPL